MSKLSKYRKKLAAIEWPAEIDGTCLNAVFYGSTPISDERVGTILSVRHREGFGLFGPTVYTFVTLCESCVHHEGRDCADPATLEEEQVTYISAIRRNGDGPLPDSPESVTTSADVHPGDD